MVRVPTVSSSGALPDANAVRTKFYPSQSAKSFLKDFFEHNPPTHLDATHQTTSRSAFSSCAGASIRDSVASRSLYSLPTISASAQSEEVAMGSQEPCSSRQADEALSSVPIVHDKSGTDSLKTLKGIKTELVKKANKPFRWSRKGHRNPLPKCGEESGGYVFTEEMLTLAPFAKVSATGSEDPLKNRHCFFCMLCKKNISMKSRGLY